MKTEITELLGIEYPIIQGGMAWVADYHLAAAVSNAGGLGIIGSGGADAEDAVHIIFMEELIAVDPHGGHAHAAGHDGNPLPVVIAGIALDTADVVD